MEIDETDPRTWAPLIDVSDMTLKEMYQGNSGIDDCIQRLIKSLDDPNGVISAFQSFAG